MSEENQNDKVTAVEKSDNVKAKDPRKVELGKRLAKISKEAKERKAKHREALCEQREQSEAIERKVDRDDRSLVEEINEYVDFRYIVGGVTIVAALGGLYYAYKSDKRQSEIESERSSEGLKTRGSSERSESQPSEEENTRIEKVKTINKNDYEITKCKPSTSKSCIENL